MSGLNSGSTSVTNMALGSSSLTTATCGSNTNHGCCDDTFGKIIGGLSKLFSIIFKLIYLFSIYFLFITYSIKYLL